MHDISDVTGQDLGACSTPFGDIDECTVWCRLVPTVERSAQRLSATLMNALALREVAQARRLAKCSTPFGDIDEWSSFSG